MKKVVKSLVVALVLCISIVALTACNKGSKSDSIVGSWKNDEYGSDFVYTFNEDGTGTYDAAGTKMEFTYEIEDDNISILYKGNTESFDTKFEIKNNTLNVVDSLGNDTLYKRVK